MKIVIEAMCDGWRIELEDGSTFSWDHNDEDLGVESLQALLENLGNDVTVEEVY